MTVDQQKLHASLTRLKENVEVCLMAMESGLQREAPPDPSATPLDLHYSYEILGGFKIKDEKLLL